MQAKRQFITVHNSCCFSKNDVSHVQQRVAPKSEISGNWRLACHMNLSLGRCPVELAQGPSSVALARGFAILEKSLDNLLEKFLTLFPEQTNPW